VGQVVAREQRLVGLVQQRNAAGGVPWHKDDFGVIAAIWQLPRALALKLHLALAAGKDGRRDSKPAFSHEPKDVD
jgi:hypothetical protein